MFSAFHTPDGFKMPSETRQAEVRTASGSFQRADADRIAYFVQ
ncbi:hypothetical protein NMH_1265 [Neisseria meningitidis H44/76]|uniref:Uncharacterized protein n=1 Tax=Neisseria meningitidis serogroup B / serotype 15 (strain H44/76) TaxID=909420 RepID=E6MY25_NEIMH|nr:hypothetical protein NMH_1265 [Neisseria meningitidis H44/76]